MIEWRDTVPTGAFQHIVGHPAGQASVYWAPERKEWRWQVCVSSYCASFEGTLFSGPVCIGNAVSSEEGRMLAEQVLNSSMVVDF